MMALVASRMASSLEHVLTSGRLSPYCSINFIAQFRNDCFSSVVALIAYLDANCFASHMKHLEVLNTLQLYP